MSKWAKRKDEPERLRGHANIKRRERIALRDGYTCQACKRITDLRDGEADHIVPMSRGGKDEDANLQWLCKAPCHEIKSARERGDKPKVAVGADGWPIATGKWE
jgi:5-methylcytosine-specific restriction protein A